MALQRTTDYELAEQATQADVRNPFERITVGMVITKNYAFTIPKVSKAGSAFVKVSNNYDVFDGQSVAEGVKDLAANCENVEQLEQALKEKLEDNKKWVYKLDELKQVGFANFFGKRTCSLSRPTKAEIINLTFKNKVEGKAIKEFHQKNK